MRAALENLFMNRNAAAAIQKMNEPKGPDETSATQVPLRRMTKNDKAILNTSKWETGDGNGSDSTIIDLKLEDKVSVADERAVFLQGLVMYVGKVHFADGIWVGIQLSGPSLGKGNCDGSWHDGKKYFAHVGKNNGVMAPIAKVNRRLGKKTGDAKLDKMQKQRMTEKARMADLKFIDCLVQERALAMLKLNEEKKKKTRSFLASNFDTEETHITRLKQMRLAEIMRSRDNDIPEDLDDVAAPNLQYSLPGSKLSPCDLEFAEGLEMTQQNYCLSDPTLPDNPIVYASQAFLNMSGYTLNEILGRNCRFLQGTDTDKYAVYRIRLSIKEGADCHVCLTNYRKDGTKFYNRLFMTALRCTKGRIKNYLGVQCEVSEKVALKINQEEREKLEGRLNQARNSTTRSLTSLGCHDNEDQNIEESFSYDGTDPLDEEDESEEADQDEDDDKEKPKPKMKRSGSKGDLYEVPETIEAHHGVDNKKVKKKKKKKSSSTSSSTSKSKSSSSSNKNKKSSGGSKSSPPKSPTKSPTKATKQVVQVQKEP